MVTDKDDQIKLIDFGLAKIAMGKNQSEVAGTPYYMAPEVLEGKYTQKADIWSMGVLVYTMVSGYLPFQGNSAADVFERIKAGKYHFNHTEFNDVSDECKSLIKQLLEHDPNKRPTGTQVLQHPWFKKYKEK